MYACVRFLVMQINVIDYFEKGALLKCRGKVAVREQNSECTFGGLELLRI